MSENKPPSPAMMLYEAARLAGFNAGNGWPDELTTHALACLMAGEDWKKGNRADTWWTMLNDAAEAGHLVARSVPLNSPGEPYPILSFFDHWHYVTRADFATWLRTAGENPGELVRAWLGMGDDVLEKRRRQVAGAPGLAMSTLAWQKARRVRVLTDYARVQSDWPAALTPGELVALQYPWEGTDPEKRKALTNQRAMVASIKIDVMAGSLATIARAVQVPIIENRTDYWAMHRQNVRAQEFGSSEWLYRDSPGLARGVISKKVKTGERTEEVQVIPCRDFAIWLDAQGELPSEHIRAWFDAKGAGVSKGDDGKNPTLEERRISAIVATARSLEYDPLKIAWGGKAAIKAECLKNAKLFTDSTFSNAWKAAVKAGKIKVEDSEKYTKR